MIPANTIIFPYGFGIGDYRIILVGFKQSNVVGYRVKICSLGIRKLICENKAVVEKHNMKALELLQFNKIDKKLNRIEED